MTRLLAGGPGRRASRVVLLGTLLAATAWSAYRWVGPGGAEASHAAEPGVVAVAADPDPPALPERLSPTFATAHEAAEALLDALAAGDVERMRALAITEAEFADVVWPELPSSRPERGLSLDYVWRDLNHKSAANLSRIVEEHGRRRYSLERVDFLDETTSYLTFEVHRQASLTLIDDQGRLRRWRLFGSMIERGGRWKIFSFVNR